MKRYIPTILLLLSVSLLMTAQPVRRVRSGIILVDTGKTVRAIEPYKANYENGAAYAAIVNKYKRTFPDANVYCMIIPNAVAFYCPDTAKTWTDAELPAIRNILSGLSADVRPVDIFETLQAHVEEPIYSRTDHHWAPLGAYYAAQRFAEVADVDFKDLSEYEPRVIHDYVGSMWTFSGDKAVKDAPEEFVYYIPRDSSFSATRITYKKVSKRVGRKRRRRTISWLTASEPESFSFFRNYEDGNSAAYCVFMGGDLNTTSVVTQTKNNRHLLILKDSYGNALPSNLFSSFEEIHVVDCRYFLQNMVEFVKAHAITDILFANNLIHASAPKTVQAYERYLTQKRTTTHEIQ
ncbi:MAG: hypothetical protein IJJ56_13835 [Prevotella sp.]|nr:hypothetical protein [Prevotella sp.]